MSSFTAFFYGFLMDNPSSVWYDIFNIGFVTFLSILGVSLAFYYFFLNYHSSRFNGWKSYLLNILIFAIILFLIEYWLAVMIGEFVDFDGEVFMFLLTNVIYFVVFYFIISLFVKERSVNGKNIPVKFKFFKGK